MSAPALHTPWVSVGEYLRLERASTAKHEYVGGAVHALAGVSKRHNRIAFNIARQLYDAAEHAGCRVYIADVKLRAAEDVIYYPDVMVACGPEGDDSHVEETPCLVVEVASPSPQATDRREKLLVYQRIPTLRAYLIVDQDRRRIERHWREGEGEWHHAEIVDAGTVPVPCPPGSALSLDGIYAGV